MSKQIPAYLLSKQTNIKMLAFNALFSFLFIVIYTPFEFSMWFRSSNTTWQLVLSVLVIIGGLGILTCSRIIMHYFYMRKGLTLLQYIFWLAGEIVLIAILYTLINTLLVHDPRPIIDIFRRSIIFIPLILVIPYMVSYLYFALKEKEIKIKELIKNAEQKTSTEPSISPMPSSSPTSTNNIINFFDEKGILKFSLHNNYIFYIEAADNYVNIYYLNKNKFEHCMLRNTLKSMEETLQNYGFARCHRSFLVNLKKVKILRKGRDGYYLDWDEEGIHEIPVSKTYTEAILKYFNE